MHSKHALEDENEEEANIAPEKTLIAEHERLAAEYQNERALLEEALRNSKDASQNASDDESTEEAGYTSVSVEKEPSVKFHLRKTEPLKPIPTATKEYDENEVFFNLHRSVILIMYK